MRTKLLRLLTRVPGVRTLWSRFPLGSVSLRTQFDVWDRPHYAFGIYSAAQLARSLGIGEISVIEFGVAGGNGLLSMERISAEVSAVMGVEIRVFGFDTGSGMPSPIDYRDLPHVWQRGFYQMDVPALKARLQSAELVLGDVKTTVISFARRTDVPPVGFISFDMDYYSSTRDAFALFEGPPGSRLPRVYCYFDDLTWPEHACHNDRVGELCAIREFNQEHERNSQHLARIHNLAWMRQHAARWNEHIYVHHDFKHPHYATLVTPEGEEFRQIRLE